MDTTSQLSVKTLNRNIKHKNRLQKPTFHNLNRREKSVTRISNKELFDIIEDFTLRNQTEWETSTREVRKPIAKATTTATFSPETKKTYVHRRSFAMGDNLPIGRNLKPPIPRELESCYLVRNYSPVRNTKKAVTRDCRPKTLASNQLSVSQPRIKQSMMKFNNDNNSILTPRIQSENCKRDFDLATHNMNKINQIEIEYQYLDRRIDNLKQDLKEVYNYLMKVKKVEKETLHETKDDNNTEKKPNNGDIINNLNLTNCINNNKMATKSNGTNDKNENIDKKCNKEVAKLNLNVLLNNDDNSSITTSSRLSECTMVSSSFMNEISHKIISNGSVDSNESIGTLGSVNSYNLLENRIAGKTTKTNNLAQKIWNAFKKKTTVLYSDKKNHLDGKKRKNNENL